MDLEVTEPLTHSFPGVVIVNTSAFSSLKKKKIDESKDMDTSTRTSAETLITMGSVDSHMGPDMQIDN